MSQTPSIGRMVHYSLSEGDATIINARRHNGVGTGNGVSAGQTFPAIITRVWSATPAATDSIQLQVFLDGDDAYWASSRTLGEPGEAGRYIWPPRV